MKILFVGDLNSHARSFQRFRAFKNLGHEVTGLSYVPEGRKPGVQGKPSLWTRICIKLGYPRDETNINRKLVDRAAELQPDIVWVEKAPMVRPKTIKEVNQVSEKTTCVYYSNDNMEKEHYQSSYFLKSIPHYDVIFTVREYSDEFYESYGATTVLSFDRGYDKIYISPRPNGLDYEYDVSFIGTYEEPRAEYICSLAESGVDVHVWGNGWDHVRPVHNLHVKHKPLYGEEFVETMHQSRILLNFFRHANDDVTTSRAFEIPASRSFMLSERTEEQRQFFEEGIEAEYFDSVDELCEKATYYLTHVDEREAIAKAGRQRCVSDRYSYHDRLGRMLDKLTDVVHSDGTER